jgi:hypothetical protein
MIRSRILLSAVLAMALTPALPALAEDAAHKDHKADAAAAGDSGQEAPAQELTADAKELIGLFGDVVAKKDGAVEKADAVAARIKAKGDKADDIEKQLVKTLDALRSVPKQKPHGVQGSKVR